MIGQEEKDAVMRVMNRGVLSGYQANWTHFNGGEEIQALEKEWAEYFGAKHAIACNSATSGLWLACAAIGIAGDGEYEDSWPNDEVIVTPFSMTCSASMPLLFGATPVFADIEKDYFCLDPEEVEKKITRNTKAIIAVDIFGQPYSEEIDILADKYNLYVIEDAAQAAGAKRNGKHCGTLGHIGVYSLNVHKPIQCGEGGMVVTDDDDLAFKIRLLMNHSESVVNDMIHKNIPTLKSITELVGMNLRMTELSAAIAREQLKKLDGIVKQAQEQAKQFDIKIRPGCTSAFYKYAWVGDMVKTDMNIKRHYIDPIYQMPLFKRLNYEQNQCPVCEDVNENIVLAWI